LPQAGRQTGDQTGGGHAPGNGAPAPGKVAYTRFFASVDLNPVGAMNQFNNVMQEAVTNFTKNVKCAVALHLDIEVSAPGGFDDATVRAVSENKAALRLDGVGISRE